jgi:hypothetical protein
MPSVRIAVAFTAAAAAALRSDVGAASQRPRAMFTLEPLHGSGKLPGAGDLVAHLRLAPRVWRVEQRTVLVDAQANATIALLVGEAADARLACDLDAERVQLTANARAAVFAEHIGRAQPDECRVLMAALSATPDLRAGDVVQDASYSRHPFFVEERLFLWTPANEVLVRYLLDVGVKPGELQQWRQ